MSQLPYGLSELIKTDELDSSLTGAEAHAQFENLQPESESNLLEFRAVLPGSPTIFNIGVLWPMEVKKNGVQNQKPIGQNFPVMF